MKSSNMHVIYGVTLLIFCMCPLMIVCDKNCMCGFYPEYDFIGPYCSNWIEGFPSFCVLSGGPNASTCAGAIQLGNESLYWTEGKEVCNRSIPPKLLSLNVRQSFTATDIAQIFFYALNLVIGTCGNAAVIKYFALSDASNRVGSRLVVALAMLDFISSVWLPCDIIVVILYDFVEFNYWPFGEVECHIFYFYPMLFYATPWFLLAISAERARAIYRPLSTKLNKKIVIFISVLILTFSFVLNLNYGLGLEYISNKFVSIDGVIYEYSICAILKNKEKEHLVYRFVSYTLGIWLPMLLIVIVYIFMYLKLKKQAEIRKRHSTQDSQRQLTQISKTFTTVLAVFYICYLPITLQEAISIYLEYFERAINTDVFNTANTINNFLLFSHSCMNPIIYSRIHRRIFDNMRQFIKACGGKCPCTIGSNRLDAKLTKFPTNVALVESSRTRNDYQRTTRQKQNVDHATGFYKRDYDLGLLRVRGDKSCKVHDDEKGSVPFSDKQNQSYENHTQDTYF